MSLRIGIYPKSFSESDLIKNNYDRVLEQAGNVEEVKKIRDLYDQILSIQIQVKNNNLSQDFKNLIHTFNNIDNLIISYFKQIMILMDKLNIRDDIILSNQQLLYFHLNTIKKFHK